MIHESQLKLIIAAIFGFGALIGVAGFLFYDEFQKRKKTQFIPVNNEDSSILKSSPFQATRSRTTSASTLFFSDNESLYTQAGSEFSDEEYYSLSEPDESQEFDLSDKKTTLRHLDSLFHQPGNIITCINELEKSLEKFGDDCEIFWRLNKCYHHLFSLEKDNKELKKSYNEKATNYGKKALNLDDSNYNAHKWYGISLGASTDYVSTKEKILIGSRFQKHIETALSLKPEDYSLYHLLGRFKYEISRLSWIERSLASTLFANPPNATYLEALQEFKRAEELNMNNPWKENKLYIAKCHHALGNRALSKELLENALDLPKTNEDDSKINEEINKLLKTLKF